MSEGRAGTTHAHRLVLVAMMVAGAVAACLAAMLAGPAGASAASIVVDPGERVTPLAAPSAKYRLAGRRWPTRTITYYNAAPQHAWALDRAARAWNASGARIRFQRTTSRRSARLAVVYEVGGTRASLTHARATLGYSSYNRVWIPRLARPTTADRYVAALLLVHELGHVLGLSHEDRRCAAMNSYVQNFSHPRCGNGRLWEWRCALVEADDVRGAIARYGGRLANLAPAFCPFYSAAAAPSVLASTFEPSAEALTLRWSTPRPVVPAWLQRRYGGNGRLSYALGIARDRCPAAPSSRSVFAEDRGDGTSTAAVDAQGLADGTYCVALWTVDELGRLGRAPATTTVIVARPPDPFDG